MQDTKEKIWMVKFRKSKAGKIMDLVYDAKEHKDKCNFHRYDKVSHLALALRISSKGTKHEEDADNLIKEIYPDYFTDPV